MCDAHPPQRTATAEVCPAQVFGRNKLKPHVPIRGFRTVREAVQYYSQPGERQGVDQSHLKFISGQWKFAVAKNPESVPENFWDAEFDDSAVSVAAAARLAPWLPCAGPDLDAPGAPAPVPQWGHIQVPGNLETQGYSRPMYTNFIYPFPMEPPFVPRDNPTGCYRHWFHVPEAWTKQVDGVLDACHALFEASSHALPRSPSRRGCTCFV